MTVDTGTTTSTSRKRKRDGRNEERGAAPEAKSRIGKVAIGEPAKGDSQSKLLRLEALILESRKNYNDIGAIIAGLRDESEETEGAIDAALTLCRIFSRLFALGRMNSSKGDPQSEVIIAQWLRDRYWEYVHVLLDWMAQDDSQKQITALKLLSRLSTEVSYDHAMKNSISPSQIWDRIVRSMLVTSHGHEVRADFITNHFQPYDDIRYLTFSSITACLAEQQQSPQLDEHVVSNTLLLLSATPDVPTTEDSFQRFYPKPSTKGKKDLLSSLTAYKKRAQGAWLSLLRFDLTKEQRKTILGLVSHRMAPWFTKMELLMDFLTDSYNQGGSTSLLALSGLFYLMQEKNLDYPEFYTKLYSLLDSNLLHSQHRSRFFRLLETFLGSTHLPAALVASFMKKLARLSLQSPPAGIVLVTPFIYNLLKKHPLCTFMIHREVRGKDAAEKLRREGMDDPFDEQTGDPMRTNAIESSLWEIEMLQSHYHPNVATLARIISEQFTKQSYNLEDFLDHSYGSMLTAELSKPVKKMPVVEYEIPKRILTTDEEQSPTPENILTRLWDFS
ncbi:MAG: hypothetical protein M1833_000403 [Piccolia ochrophora]|nr:MAG: hypothetical protein M1833_000403 [Piccolia ochrophora]